MFQDMVFCAYLFLDLSLFVHVLPLLNGVACIVSQHLIFISLVIPNVVCALIFQVTYIDFPRHDGYVYVLVLSLFRHVIPLLIGLTYFVFVLSLFFTWLLC